MRYGIVTAAVMAAALSGCGGETQGKHEQDKAHAAGSHKEGGGAESNAKEMLSQKSHAETVSAMRAALKKRGLNVFAEVDHAANAKQAGLELGANTLFIFGNPKAGTPLMVKAPGIGIDLPMKMQVLQTGDDVQIRYTDIVHVARHYGIDGSEMPVPKIAETLSGIAKEAAGE